ncbi:MAG: PAS domain S-box protein [Thermoguttaceae bacterium]
MPEHLLLVEDNASDALLLQTMLDSRRPGQYATVSVATLEEAKAAVWQQTFDAALLDLSLPDSQGLETIGQLAAAAPNLPIVVLTGVADEAVAREAVRCGAQDYLVKGQADATTIDQAIHYAVDRKQVEETLHAQQRELEAKNRELLEAQRRLEAYRDRYVDLYDSAPLGYVTLDEEGYVQEINLAGAQLLNADRDALTGYPFSQNVTKEDMPVFLDHLRKCVDEHCKTTSELRLVARGGRLITVQLHSIPVKGSAEDVTFYKTAITDITQRKQVEEAIRQSGAFLQTVIDAIPDVMLVVGTDYRIVLANRAAREMAEGIDPTTGLTCHQLSHHRDLPCTGKDEPCPLRQAIAAKSPVTVLHTHYDSHGKEFFVEVTAAPVLNEMGEVSYVIEACRDVSERKRAEELLRREKAFADVVIDSIPAVFYVLDSQGRFVRCNRLLQELTGLTAEMLRGTDALRTIFADDRQRVAAKIREVFEKGQAEVEARFLGKDEVREFLFTGRRMDVGSTSCLVGSGVDITDRKHAEEMLRLTQFSVDHAADPAFWVGPDARIAYANSSACKQLGYSREELLSLTVHHIDPDFPAEVWPEHWEELKRRGCLTFESRHRSKDGKLFPVEVTASYLAFAGKEYNCASVRDISDRKRSEESLRRAAQELERSNKDLEQFASVASHDLQEPLRTVSGFVQLLQSKYAGQLDAEADTFIKYAVDGAKRMETLIRDLLAYARVTSRSGEMVSTDAGAALRQALDNLQASIQEKGAEIVHGELPIVRADAAQLAQLFQNLIGNALKFRSEAPPEIHVDACREADYWRFSVRDNGIGIDARFQDHIFEMFHRLHSRQQYDGSGIGLAICKKIVDRHGGRIWVESEPGQGATFHFTIAI